MTGRGSILIKGSLSWGPHRLSHAADGDGCPSAAGSPKQLRMVRRVNMTSSPSEARRQQKLFPIKTGLTSPGPPRRGRIARCDLGWSQRDQMAALVRIAPDFGALAAAHVAFQFMDRRCLRSPHDVEGNGLMRVAAKAFHFEITIPGIDRVAQRRRWLRRTLKAKHALIPRLDGEPVGFLACFRRPLCRRPDRCAVNASRVTWCPWREDAPGHDGQASRYRLRWMACRLPALAIKSRARNRAAQAANGRCDHAP